MLSGFFAKLTAFVFEKKILLNKVSIKNPIEKGLRTRRKRYSTNRYLIYTIPLIIIISGAWLGYEITHLKPATAWFEANAENNSKIKLPRDDAPHQAKIEWWYYNGHLTSESGKQFSFHDTVFLVNSMTSHIVSHVSLNDHQTGKYFTHQLRSGGNPSVNTVSRFEFKQGDWLMAGGNGKDRLKIITQDFSFDLDVISTLPPVLYGDGGIISLGSAGSSYYYSRQRMAVSGTVTTGDKTEKVTGISWFDHQWGDFSVGQLSWDWFSLQLENDMTAMIYQLRDKSDQPVLYMASITQNGATELLRDNEFTLIPGEKWLSKKTGLSYPLEWKISIPKKNINITTRSIIKNCEFNARLTTYNIYWEGAIEIQGTHNGQGFMELSGYSSEIPDT
jgi:predicted secreted hydrolase